MNELLHLRAGGGENARMVVAGVDDGDAAEAVEVGLAVIGEESTAVGADDDDRLDSLGDDGEDEAGVLRARVHIDDTPFDTDKEEDASWRRLHGRPGRGLLDDGAAQRADQSRAAR